MHVLFNSEAPILSAPYLHVDDAMIEAPERALILWHVTEGVYQFMTIHAETATVRQLRALVNGVQEVTDLCALAYRIDGEWCHWTG
jgi:hypothetical protein